MLRYDKQGNAICEVCGIYWSSHTIGGNCPRRPISVQARRTLRRIYRVHRKNIGGISSVVVR